MLFVVFRARSLSFFVSLFDFSSVAAFSFCIFDFVLAFLLGELKFVLAIAISKLTFVPFMYKG